MMISCNNKDEPKFEKIKYSLKYNYRDSLRAKIIPNKTYEYWGFMSYKSLMIMKNTLF